MRKEQFITVKKYKDGQPLMIEYLDVAFSFDIESTSFNTYKGKVISEKELNELDFKEQFEVIPHATMYVWQADFNDEITVKRTWQEFKDYMNTIIDKYQLSPTRRVICWVHNLAFESEWISKFFHFISEESLCLKSNKPVVLPTMEGIEFRCSYVMSGVALKDIVLYKHNVEKMVGDLDYNLIRHSETPLTEKEMGYCINDVKVVNAYVEEEAEKYGAICLIPETSTGKLRRHCRELLLKDKNYKKKVQSMILDKDDYIMLRKAFNGGFTHAGNHHFKDICGEDGSKLVHVDFSSSYPAVMVLFPEYATGNSTTIDLNTLTIDKFNEYINNKFCVMKVFLEDVESKFDYEFVLSESKIENLKYYDDAPKTSQVFNGRVKRFKSGITYINNIDYEVLQKFYSFKMSVLEMKTWKKDYLPKPLILEILRLYNDKTKLKGVEGEEPQYNLSKTFINGLYGMCATDIIRDEVYFETGETGNYKVIKYKKVRGDDKQRPEALYEDVEENEPNINALLYRYNNSKNRFISYTWTVITSLARRNLFTGILAAGKDYIYSDTDSIFAYDSPEFEEYVQNYNRYIDSLIEAVCKRYDLDPKLFSPKTIKGKTKTIGYWDYEEAPKLFKTLGAKRYLEMFEDGHLKLTFAGVSKKEGVKYLQEFNKTENGIPECFFKFDEDLIFPYDKGGKLITSRLPEEEGELTDYLGNTAHYHDYGAINLTRKKYELSNISALTDFILYSMEL